MLRHFWTVKGPDVDTGQWDVSCCCGYADTFDSLYDVEAGWYEGPCTAPNQRETRDRKPHWLDGRGRCVDCGQVEPEEGAECSGPMRYRIAAEGREGLND